MTELSIRGYGSALTYLNGTDVFSAAAKVVFDDLVERAKRPLGRIPGRVP